jgi:hypothetical protein
MRQLSTLFESGNYTLENDGILRVFKKAIEEKHTAISEELARIVRKIEAISLTKEVIDWNN